MGKLRRKNKSEAEYYRGLLREYEAEIKSLRQKLRQYEKYDRSQDNEIIHDSEDTKKDLKMRIDCVDCGKGKIIETLDLGHRGIYGECNICGYKGRMK